MGAEKVKTELIDLIRTRSIEVTSGRALHSSLEGLLLETGAASQETGSNCLLWSADGSEALGEYD
jgi:hypothetical protein